MPEGASLAKQMATRSYGGEVILFGRLHPCVNTGGGLIAEASAALEREKSARSPSAVHV
jgi:threonine dehydratase